MIIETVFVKIMVKNSQPKIFICVQLAKTMSKNLEPSTQNRKMQIFLDKNGVAYNCQTLLAIFECEQLK